MCACESENLPAAPGALCPARVASWTGRMAKARNRAALFGRATGRLSRLYVLLGGGHPVVSKDV